MKKIKLTNALGFMHSTSLLATWWVSCFLLYKNNGLVKDEAIQSGEDTGQNIDFIMILLYCIRLVFMRLYDNCHKTGKPNKVF